MHVTLNADPDPLQGLIPVSQLQVPIRGLDRRLQGGLSDKISNRLSQINPVSVLCN